MAVFKKLKNNIILVKNTLKKIITIILNTLNYKVKTPKALPANYIITESTSIPNLLFNYVPI